MAGLLVGQLMDEATFSRAADEAARSGRAIVDVALALGWLDEAAYVRLLAERIGVPAVTEPDRVAGAASEPWYKAGRARGHAPAGVTCRIGGTSYVLIAAADLDVVALSHRMAHARRQGERPALATRAVLSSGVAAAASARLEDAAVNALARRNPEASARSRVWLWQALTIAIGLGMIVGTALVAPGEAMRLVMIGLVLPFSCIVLVRLWALAQQCRGSPEPAAGRAMARLPDRELPVYSVLVPLFREVRVLPQLVRALTSLDYPSAKLDIVLVLESVDAETRAAAARLALPGNVRVVVVPDCQPRTKPKALNYALGFAKGSYVVVFDAEDLPEPDQLRRAIDVFRLSPPNVACVQAALNVYNPRASWLSRQFAIEYSVLFDALLPAYERLGVPVPLGGTSNHFPVATLVGLGGWDPFNVTEDADLGIRMARNGLATRTIASTTWEEAPIGFRAWLMQRTRWLKGWMQTYLVHMRRPARLYDDLGLRGFAGFQIIIGGIVLSALVHPLAYLALALEAWTGALWRPSESWLDAVIWHLSFATLAAGYVASMLTGIVAAIRRRRWWLVPGALLMPAYWLLVSVAAYRAAYQLVRDPFRWEKTEHGHALASMPPARTSLPTRAS